MKYLAKSLVEESQSYIRFTSEDWARLVNDIVERSVFGKTVTKPVYKTEKEALAVAKEMLVELLNDFEKIEKDIPIRETHE